MPAAPLPDRFNDGPLVARCWRGDDVHALADAITDNLDHLRPWMAWIAFEPQTIAQREELIGRWERERLDGGDVVLGVFIHDHVVGGTGLHRRIGPDGLEIGYWISDDHLRMGLATRVSRTLTTGAFTIAGITHVEIHCDAANTASAKVPERLGFSYTGDVERPITAPSETGTHRVYRMTKDDWAATNHGTVPG